MQQKVSENIAMQVRRRKRAPLPLNDVSGHSHSHESTKPVIAPDMKIPLPHSGLPISTTVANATENTNVTTVQIDKKIATFEKAENVSSHHRMSVNIKDIGNVDPLPIPGKHSSIAADPNQGNVSSLTKAFLITSPFFFAIVLVPLSLYLYKRYTKSKQRANNAEPPTVEDYSGDTFKDSKNAKLADGFTVQPQIAPPPLAHIPSASPVQQSEGIEYDITYPYLSRSRPVSTSESTVIGNDGNIFKGDITDTNAIQSLENNSSTHSNVQQEPVTPARRANDCRLISICEDYQSPPTAHPPYFDASDSTSLYSLQYYDDLAGLAREAYEAELMTGNDAAIDLTKAEERDSIISKSSSVVSAYYEKYGNGEVHATINDEDHGNEDENDLT